MRANLIEFTALSGDRPVCFFEWRLGAIRRVGVRHNTRALCYNFEVCERRETNQAVFCLGNRAGRGIPVLRAAGGGEARDCRLRSEPV